MLTGKVAVITGASSGIGAALARALNREGSSLVLAARRLEKTDALASELRGTREQRNEILTRRCDVSVRDDAEQLINETVRRFGRIDILVNNAGRGHFASVEETSDETIASMFAVNVYSLWYTSRPALVHMRQQGSGHIINIASIAGKVGFPYNSAYVAAKHAVVGFTHALRMELAETGIHASVVCPAGVLTEWANTTEGGPIQEMFSRSGPVIKRIAAERGIELPPIEGVIGPEAVAEKVVECIYSPSAEVYTHRGSREFALLAARNREEAEHHQLPVALGERAVYASLRGQ
jgi:short-subunit dehydrogenase